jgi:hypothetical protein
MFFGGSGFESFFMLSFGIVFVFVIAIFVIVIARGIGTWRKNNQSPRLTVEARVVSKRINVSHHAHAHHDGAAGMHSSTQYFVTFQVESGDRMEFSVSGMEYGMLAEGDTGKLSFQGTRYLSFERI